MHLNQRTGNTNVFWLIIGLVIAGGLVWWLMKEVPPPEDDDIVDVKATEQERLRDWLKKKEEEESRKAEMSQAPPNVPRVTDNNQEQEFPQAPLIAENDSVADSRKRIIAQVHDYKHLTPVLDPIVKRLLESALTEKDPKQLSDLVDQLKRTSNEHENIVKTLVLSLLENDQDRHATNDLLQTRHWKLLNELDSDFSVTVKTLWEIYYLSSDHHWDVLWMLVHVQPENKLLAEKAIDKSMDALTSLKQIENLRILLFLQPAQNETLVKKLWEIYETGKQMDFPQVIYVMVGLWRAGEPMDEIMAKILNEYDTKVIESAFASAFLDDEVFNQSRIVRPFARALLDYHEHRDRTGPQPKYNLNIPKLVEKYTD